jgi:hypothetical protein
MYPRIPSERVVDPLGSAEHTFGTSDLKGKGKVHPKQGTKAQRESRGIALLFL